MAERIEVVSLRLAHGQLKAADALIPKIKQSPLGAAVRVSRGTVLRLALARGLEELAKEYK